MGGGNGAKSAKSRERNAKAKGPEAKSILKEKEKMMSHMCMICRVRGPFALSRGVGEWVGGFRVDGCGVWVCRWADWQGWRKGGLVGMLVDSYCRWWYA